MRPLTCCPSTLVTKSVFDALFDGYTFTALNPVSQSTERVLHILEAHALWKEDYSKPPMRGPMIIAITHVGIDRSHRGIPNGKGRSEGPAALANELPS